MLIGKGRAEGSPVSLVDTGNRLAGAAPRGAPGRPGDHLFSPVPARLAAPPAPRSEHWPAPSPTIGSRPGWLTRSAKRAGGGPSSGHRRDGGTRFDWKRQQALASSPMKSSRGAESFDVAKPGRCEAMAFNLPGRRYRSAALVAWKAAPWQSRSATVDCPRSLPPDDAPNVPSC